MFDFRRATIFFFGKPFFKAQNGLVCQKLGGACPRLRLWMRRL